MSNKEFYSFTNMMQCFYVNFFFIVLVKVAVVLLAFGVACVSAGSYGGQGQRLGVGYQQYAQYVQPHYVQPQYAQIQYYQPVAANVGGSGSGNLFGGSGNLGGGYGYGGGVGGGSDFGVIIPIIIICKYSFYIIHFFLMKEYSYLSIR